MTSGDEAKSERSRCAWIHDPIPSLTIRLLSVAASSIALGAVVFDLFDLPNVFQFGRRESGTVTETWLYAIGALIPWAWRGVWADGLVVLVLMLGATAAWNVKGIDDDAVRAAAGRSTPAASPSPTPEPVLVRLPHSSLRPIENKLDQFATLIVVRVLGKANAPTKVDTETYDVEIDAGTPSGVVRADIIVSLPNETPPDAATIAPIVRDVATAKALFLVPRAEPTPKPTPKPKR